MDDDQRFQPGRVDRLRRRIGLGGKYDAFWSWYQDRNFGDWITPYLIEKKTGETPTFFTSTQVRQPACIIYGAGSIMRHIKRANVAVVWGSGIISQADEFQRPKKILAVRGPFSRKRCRELGYASPEIFGDPGILLSQIYNKNKEPDGVIGVIPHYKMLKKTRSMFERVDGVRVIDVTTPVEVVIDEICRCSFTLSSSLHGIIVSHSYSIPSAWVWVTDNDARDGTKYHDYYLGIGLTSVPRPIKLNGTEDYRDLKAIAETDGSAAPDLMQAQTALRTCCPF